MKISTLLEVWNGLRLLNCGHNLQPVRILNRFAVFASFRSSLKMADVADSAQERSFLTYSGPKDGVRYPLKVKYCGGC